MTHSRISGGVLAGQGNRRREVAKQARGTMWRHVGGVPLSDSSTVVRVAFSPREVAEMLGIAPSTLYRYMNAGEIRSLKVGGRRFISMTAVNAFVDASRVVPVESVA